MPYLYGLTDFTLYFSIYIKNILSYPCVFPYCPKPDWIVISSKVSSCRENKVCTRWSFPIRRKVNFVQFVSPSVIQSPLSYTVGAGGFHPAKFKITKKTMQRISSCYKFLIHQNPTRSVIGCIPNNPIELRTRC